MISLLLIYVFQVQKLSLLVKSLETVLPVDHIAPESSKLFVANLPRLVFVKKTCKPIIEPKRKQKSYLSCCWWWPCWTRFRCRWPTPSATRQEWLSPICLHRLWRKTWQRNLLLISHLSKYPFNWVSPGMFGGGGAGLRGLKFDILARFLTLGSKSRSLELCQLSWWWNSLMLCITASYGGVWEKDLNWAAGWGELCRQWWSNWTVSNWRVRRPFSSPATALTHKCYYWVLPLLTHNYCRQPARTSWGCSMLAASLSSSLR